MKILLFTSIRDLFPIPRYLVECEANPEVPIEIPRVPDFQSKSKRANLKSL